MTPWFREALRTGWASPLSLPCQDGAPPSPGGNAWILWDPHPSGSPAGAALLFGLHGGFFPQAPTGPWPSSPAPPFLLVPMSDSLRLFPVFTFLLFPRICIRSLR